MFGPEGTYHMLSKSRLYNALIVPIVSYAAETWTLKAEDERKLTVFEND